MRAMLRGFLLGAVLKYVYELGRRDGWRLARQPFGTASPSWGQS